MAAIASIHEFDETRHLDGVRACLIELQDFERCLDPRMPSGKAIVDVYIPLMIRACVDCAGTILVAETDARVSGFATVLTRVTSDLIEDGDTEFGLISDLVVSREFRGRGIGRMLLECAENHARDNNVRWLRIGVLAANLVADRLYDAMGFERRYVEREKLLEPAK